MRLQEGITSKLNALAKESKTFEAFKKAAKEMISADANVDLDADEDLKDIYDSAHKVAEALAADADTGEYIKDFEKSKAPQFRGKSKKKRREMAIAASMNAKKGKLTKEDILKAVKEVLAENITQNVVTATNKPDIKKVLQQKGVTDTSVVDKAKPGQIIAAEDHNLDPADESSMAKSQLYSIAKYAIELMKMIEDGEQLDAWVQSKITKAADYVNSVKNYMEGEKALSEVGGVDEIQTDMFATRASKADSGKETYFKFLRAFAKSAGKSEEELRKMSYNDLEKEFGQELARKHGLEKINVADKAKELIAKGIIQREEIEEVKKKLDPVGHEDEDVDNDGKKNTKTDKYLKGRRVKIGQAIAQYKKK